MRFDASELDPRHAYALLIGAVVPRPIAFVTTVDGEGRVNLAPYSFFTGVCSRPPMVCISAGVRRWQGAWQPKDTLANIRATGELVVNIASQELADAVNACAEELPPGQSELERAGLHALPSEHVRPPRVQECAVQMECKLDQIVMVGRPATQALALAEVVCFHVRDEVWSEELGGIDPDKLRPLSRLGGALFGAYGGSFERQRPDWLASGFSARVDKAPKT